MISDMRLALFENMAIYIVRIEFNSEQVWLNIVDEWFEAWIGWGASSLELCVFEWIELWVSLIESRERAIWGSHRLGDQAIEIIYAFDSILSEFDWPQGMSDLMFIFRGRAIANVFIWSNSEWVWFEEREWVIRGLHWLRGQVIWIVHIWVNSE
jgi:hypothetical protein